MVYVCPSSFLLGVDDGCLNSGVRPIRCVGPESVYNTYRPSCLIIWKQGLIRMFRACHPIPSDTFPKHGGHSS